MATANFERRLQFVRSAPAGRSEYPARMDGCLVNDSSSLNIHNNAGQRARAEQTSTHTDLVPAGNAFESPNASMRCPACRAQQIWSPECRRCGAELTMLRQTETTCQLQRTRSLTALRDGHYHAATRHAFRLFQLRPDAQSTRLLAVCLLVSGNFAQACRIAKTQEP